MNLVPIAFLLLPSISLSKHIEISLESQWQYTPILLEACEFYRRYQPTYFWQFQELTSKEYLPYCQNSSNEEYCVNEILAISENILSSNIVILLGMLLRSRYYSAAVQTLFTLSPKQHSSECFVDIGNKIISNVNELESELLSCNTTSDVTVYPIVDIFYDNVATANLTAILYCYPSTDFLKFHEVLKAFANKGLIRYSSRYAVHSSGIISKRLALSGYAAELQIKSTEYKSHDDTLSKSNKSHFNDNLDGVVKGFDFNVLSSIQPDLNDNLLQFKKYLLANESSLLELKPWEVQLLSYQTAKVILNHSADVSWAFQEYSQNFLMHLRELSDTSVTEAEMEALKANINIYQTVFNEHPNDNDWTHRLLINGLQFESTEYFSFIDFLRDELNLIDRINRASDKVNALRLLYRLTKENIPFNSKDSFVLDFRNESIIWFNDIERDENYAYWSSQLFDVLRSMPFVKRNIYHLVIYIPENGLMSRNEELKDILSTLDSILDSNNPFRLGTVIVPHADYLGNPCINCLLSKLSSKNRLKFLKYICESDLAISHILKKFTNAQQVNKIIAQCQSRSQSDKAHNYFQSTGIDRLPSIIFNGVLLDNSNSYEKDIRSEYIKEKNKVSMLILNGLISDRTSSVIDYLMATSNARKRINYQLISKKPIFLNDIEANELLSSSVHYFFKESQFKDITANESKVTIWLAVNLENSSGRKTLLSVLNYLKRNEHVRLSVILNPKNDDPSFNNSRIFESALRSKQNQAATKRFLIKFLQQAEQEVLQIPNVTGFNISKLKGHMKDREAFQNDLEKYFEWSRLFKGIKSGQTGLIINGRVICPIENVITLDDFEFLVGQVIDFSKILFDELTLSKSVKESSESRCADDIFKLCNVLMSEKDFPTRIKVPFQAPLTIPNKISNAIKLVLFVDPASEVAQEISPLLNYIRPLASIDVFFICRPMLSDLPIKRIFKNSFSQLSVDSKPIRFDNVPSLQLFSLNIIVPHAWMIAPVESIYDLDNIRLSDTSDDVVYAKFELDYILIEGQCFDIHGATYAKGLELTLSHRSNQYNITEYDTIVMANLGYFQLKSSPGVWSLNIRPKSNSSNTFKLAKLVTVLCDSLSGHLINVEVFSVDESKKDKKSDGLWTLFFPKSNSVDNQNLNYKNSDRVVNIFSIASGHLYERFLRIMMLSVITHTKQSKVKFWFLKNFLSPNFVQLLPKYAKAYNFEFELVQYKWPRWLTVYPKQKQRVIWGYKILFLDVLFPLNVSRIIFVDADQVVRTDMTELYEMDLKGAPYGYTPFCNSRKEMDGYRFWKDGYWAAHLGHRKYHISALYVVDLDKFRQISAGDRLRGQYFALSQDPNSLSNLDQDLPNNMIHQVSIFSLPQEWLWCETWCDDASKSKAKTIDLCNNPMTKEPKLQSARRIIKEWDSYDQEIRNFMNNLDNEQFSDKQAQTNDVFRDEL
ncbi:hypothetical protein GJ496_004338 [Pomphorhynchus laevis]|nr:hypothetical protein GJ496_004338 [Pomphorhynchus laevis]